MALLSLPVSEAARRKAASKTVDNIINNDLARLFAKLRISDAIVSVKTRALLHRSDMATKRKRAGASTLPAETQKRTLNRRRHLKRATRALAVNSMDIDVPAVAEGDRDGSSIPMDTNEPERSPGGSSGLSETVSVEADMADVVAPVRKAQPGSQSRPVRADDAMRALYARWLADPHARLHPVPGVHHQLQRKMKEIHLCRNARAQEID